VRPHPSPAVLQSIMPKRAKHLAVSMKDTSGTIAKGATFECGHRIK